MADWVRDFFIQPIETGSGYNVVNTAVYAAILIASLFLLVKLLRKLNIRMDKKLWFDLLPFVFLGGVLRALEDANFFAFLGSAKFVFVTPLIYVVLFGIAFASLLVSKYVYKNFARLFGAGLLAVFGVQALVLGKNWNAFAETMLVSIVIVAAVYAAVSFRTRFLRGTNWQVLYAHVLDATASTIAVTGFGFREQHVVPSAILSVLPTWFFIPIKMAVVLFALYAIDSNTGSEKGKLNADWNWMLKFCLLVLGLGPGTRDALTLLINS